MVHVVHWWVLGASPSPWDQVNNDFPLAFSPFLSSLIIHHAVGSVSTPSRCDGMLQQPPAQFGSRSGHAIIFFGLPFHRTRGSTQSGRSGLTTSLHKAPPCFADLSHARHR